MSTQYDTNDGSKSPEEVQREVRQSRAEVEQNLDAIQDRLSPGQLFEQAVDYMRSSTGNDLRAESRRQSSREPAADLPVGHRVGLADAFGYPLEAKKLLRGRRLAGGPLRQG
jgi:hypothetical protein